MGIPTQARFRFLPTSLLEVGIGTAAKSLEEILWPNMRIWDVPVECLCRNHLLAEHRELHAIWSIIINDKRGYSRHPEVMRWRGRLVALWERHEAQRLEMAKRGYAHKSPLDKKAIPRVHRGRGPVVLLDPVGDQRRDLRDKGCSCNLQGARKLFTSGQSMRCAHIGEARIRKSYGRAEGSSETD